MDKRTVFLDDEDRFRFIHDLFEFNDEAPADHVYYRRQYRQLTDPQLRKMRNCLVEILAFVLMPNHFHMMIRQLARDGVQRFMQKVGTGYTYYFNQRNERSGALFQGRFKAVLLNDERHFEYLPYYIHLNPLDLVTPEWRDGRIDDKDKALNFLKTYRWSSYQDYAGTDNFPSILHMDFLKKSLGEAPQFQSSMERYITLLNGPDAPRDVYID